MQDDLRRFLRVSLIICSIAIILFISLKANTLADAVKLAIIPTFVFIPIGYLILKFKLYLNEPFSNKYSRIIILISIVVGMTTANKLTLYTKISLVIFGFEMICLYYYALFIKKNNSA